jgi:hypothetical protein
MLTEATQEVQQLDPTDTQAWVHSTSQTADLVAVLGRRLEPEPGPLHHAGLHLARAAQPDPDQRRSSATGPIGQPLLVEIARLVAYSRDPAQTAAIAAVVLLTYGLIRLLDHLATQRHAHPAARRQVQLAADRLAEHALITNHATGPTTDRGPIASQRSTAELDHQRRTRRAVPTWRPARRP